jgi:hypothetical protein
MKRGRSPHHVSDIHEALTLNASPARGFTCLDYNVELRFGAAITLAAWPQGIVHSDDIVRMDDVAGHDGRHHAPGVLGREMRHVRRVDYEAH